MELLTLHLVGILIIGVDGFVRPERFPGRGARLVDDVEPRLGKHELRAPAVERLRGVSD